MNNIIDSGFPQNNIVIDEGKNFSSIVKKGE